MGHSTVKPDKQEIYKSSSFDAGNNWILQNGLYSVEEVLWVSLTEKFAELLLVFAKFKSEIVFPGNCSFSFPNRPHPESGKNLNIEH